jgi:hypothetical protein
VNSYTFEASFLGPNVGPLAGYHFNTRSYEAMGESLAKAILHTFTDYRGSMQEAARNMNVILQVRELGCLRKIRQQPAQSGSWLPQEMVSSSRSPSKTGGEGGGEGVGTPSAVSNNSKEDNGSDTGDSDNEDEEGGAGADGEGLTTKDTDPKRVRPTSCIERPVVALSQTKVFIRQGRVSVSKSKRRSVPLPPKLKGGTALRPSVINPPGPLKGPQVYIRAKACRLDEHRSVSLHRFVSVPVWRCGGGRGIMCGTEDTETDSKVKQGQLAVISLYGL